MLTLLVHLVHTPSPVPAQKIFTYGTASEPYNPILRNNTTNPVTKLPADLDSGPSLSYSPLSDLFDSSDYDYLKKKTCKKE